MDRVLAEPGVPLESSLRHEMQARIGYDFSAVRVHADAAAAQSARQVKASAYTVGDHIVFGSGRFTPATGEGRRLIAHELTHVAQQGRPEVARSGDGWPLLRQTEDDSQEERHREAVELVQADIPLALSTPIVLDDDAPTLITWAERSALRFDAPDVTDAERGRIAQGMTRVFDQLNEFQSRSKRDRDGALLYTDLLVGDQGVPWTSERPRAVSELPLFTPAAVNRWRRVADLAGTAGAQPTSAHRPPARPVRLVSPAGRPVTVSRSANSITFTKRAGMTVATPEGQREIIWLYIAATHSGLTDDQIGWAVSKLGPEADGGSRLTERWRDTFEKASAEKNEKVTLTSDQGFERDLDRVLANVPSQQAFQFGALGQAGRDARGGLLLGYGVVALGVVAGTGGAALGGLAALGGDLVLGGSLIEGGALAGGETLSFGSLAATGARYAGTQLYLNAPALYSSAALAYGGYLTEEATAEHIARMRSEGASWQDIPEFVGDFAPLAEGTAPFISGRSPSGAPAPGPASEPAEPDLGARPPAGDSYDVEIQARPLPAEASRAVEDLPAATRDGADVAPSARRWVPGFARSATPPADAPPSISPRVPGLARSATPTADAPAAISPQVAGFARDIRSAPPRGIVPQELQVATELPQARLEPSSPSGPGPGAATGQRSGQPVRAMAGKLPDDDGPRGPAIVSRPAAPAVTRAPEVVDQELESAGRRGPRYKPAPKPGIDPYENYIRARDAAARSSGLGAEQKPHFVESVGSGNAHLVGRRNGYMSKDGTRGWRLDYSPRQGVHVNWWRTEGGVLYQGAITVGGDETTFFRLLEGHFGRPPD